MAEGRYAPTSDGVIIYPENRVTDQAAAVKVSVIAENIFRVVSCPEGAPIREKESLITAYKGDSLRKWDLFHNDSEGIIKTRLVTARIILSGGVVKFADEKGGPILAEKGPGGRSFGASVGNRDQRARAHICQRGFHPPYWGRPAIYQRKTPGYDHFVRIHGRGRAFYSL